MTFLYDIWLDFYLLVCLRRLLFLVRKYRSPSKSYCSSEAEDLLLNRYPSKEMLAPKDRNPTEHLIFCMKNKAVVPHLGSVSLRMSGLRPQAAEGCCVSS